MKRSIRIGLVFITMVVVVSIVVAARSSTDRGGVDADRAGSYATAMPDKVRQFADAVDLDPFTKIAVYTEGRIKSFGSHAAAIMHDITGPYDINDRDESYNYLDLMFRPQQYASADILFCKHKLLRREIAEKVIASFDDALASAQRLVQTTTPDAARRQVHALLAHYDHRLAVMAKYNIASTTDLVRVLFPREQGTVRSDVTIEQLREVVRAMTSEQWSATSISRDELAVMLDLLTPAGGAQPDVIPADVSHRFTTRMERFLKTGLISLDLIELDPVLDHLMALSEDVIRWSKPVGQVNTARFRARQTELFMGLRIVAPVGGGFDDPWLGLQELQQRVTDYHRQESELAAQLQAIRSSGGPAASTVQAQLDEVRERRTLHEQILTQWQGMVNGWSGLDAEAVNEATSRMAVLLRAINPDVYPSLQKLSWETSYFKLKNLTWIWVVYALSLVPLLMSVVFRWRAARWIGLGMFMIAFLMHTAAIGLRWYVAGRWPNSNMFEAVTTAAWFGGCLTVLLEALLGRTPIRGFFALASAVASMTALMAAHYLPLQLNPNISNMMPVLHDLWLYIHTNVIIFSYCLVFMAAVSAVLYLVYRGAKWLSGRPGKGDFARVGGAGSLIMTSASGESYISRARTSAGQVLDGATMILLELAFVLLWAGIVMGAIWADHSWGRPWGWDPKEVFALNTFIVFIVLIHVRLKASDKGLWTALLAIVGAGAMIFNWTAINFVITGLHSYA